MDKYVNVRSIAAERERTFKSTVVRWESLLVLMFIAVNIMNICISPNYLKVDNLSTAISNFLPTARARSAKMRLPSRMLTATCRSTLR